MFVKRSSGKKNKTFFRKKKKKHRFDLIGMLARKQQKKRSTSINEIFFYPGFVTENIYFKTLFRFERLFAGIVGGVEKIGRWIDVCSGVQKGTILSISNNSR